MHRSILPVVLALFAPAACPAPPTPCDRSGCEAAGAPVASPSIDEGIAGVAAAQSDACAAENGGAPCCACTLSTATLTVFPTTALVDDADEAESVVRAEEGAIAIAIDEAYEQALAPGAYLGCLLNGAQGACAPFTVRAGDVTSVHVVASNGPGLVKTFGAGGAAGPASFVVVDRRQ